MAEYIEREAVIDQITCRYENPEICTQEINSIPAADVAPVVRCKGCKYSCEDGTGRTCEGYWHELSEYAVSVKDDAFCSYGDPKEGTHADDHD